MVRRAIETIGKMLVLTYSGVVDENGGTAMSLADGAAKVNQIWKVGDVAFVVVNFWHWTG